MRIRVLIGTAKGAFRLETDNRCAPWRLEGPFFKGWRVTAFSRGAQDNGDWLAATASPVYGAAIHRSDDLISWRQVEDGPRGDADGDTKLNEIWTMHRAGATLFAGVDEAALFRSDDGGGIWRRVDGLTSHASRDSWFPGFGGLCAHSILSDPSSSRLWVGISAVGVFRSDDDGATWTPKNAGVRQMIDGGCSDIGYCVHSLAADADAPDRIFRQDHAGMYRTDDGGDSWTAIESGLPSSFGFPLARARGALFAVPLESDEYRMPTDGALRLYKSEDDGATWRAAGEGLPSEHAYTGVLRAGLATDGGDPAGVYLGTSSGTVHVSADAGETFTTIPCLLPRILCVEAFQLD